jgi:UDPglucose--hexose-1-phosphate uridylyltransferase
MRLDISEHPHRRQNLLTGEWVLVSPHRTKRPWQGGIEKSIVDDRPKHDPNCYLCSGNTRANGEVNPHYEDTFVFVNDFAALNLETQSMDAAESPDVQLMKNQPASGECRVICYSPRHDLTLTEMSEPGICSVVDMWQREYHELVEKYQWVQIFENKGSMMGCSNPHPHGQIWASDFVPTTPSNWDVQQKAYFVKNDRPLLVDYAQAELNAGARTVEENAHWIVVVPYWAAWPFETLLLPKRHIPNMSCMTDKEKRSLAQILKKFLTRYDNLFDTVFPYSMGWYQSMQKPMQNDYWQLSALFMPPLLRSATVKKFMVGYELFGETQRDITPEQAAEKLRATSTKHFKS